MHIDEVPFMSAKIKLSDSITGAKVVGYDAPATRGKDNIPIQKLTLINSAKEKIYLTVWNPEGNLKIFQDQTVSIKGADTSIFKTDKGKEYKQMSCNYKSLSGEGSSESKKALAAPVKEMSKQMTSTDLDLWFDVFDQVVDRFKSEVYTELEPTIDDMRQVTTSLRIGGYRA
jgi:hypothetical protein